MKPFVFQSRSFFTASFFLAAVLWVVGSGCSSSQSSYPPPYGSQQPQQQGWAYGNPPPQGYQPSPGGHQPSPYTGSAAEVTIQQGDPLTIRITGITPEITQQEEVNEFGMVSLPYINNVKAEGLTPGVLQRKIERAYLDGGYFTKLSVSVLPGIRVLYVHGEVRAPGKVTWTSGLTVGKAISLAGGFTDYASRSAVELNRKGNVYKINLKEAERDPSKDVEVFPRDDIKVGRSLF